MLMTMSTFSGFVVAISRFTGLHKVLVKKSLQWCFSCRYSSNTVSRRRNVSRYVHSFLRYFRRGTGLRAQRWETLLTSLGRWLQCVVDVINDFRHPMNNLKVDPGSVPHLNIVLSNCHLQRPLPFWIAVPFWKQAHAVKLGEGSYGEVYLTRHIDGTDRAMKLLAVNGIHPETNLLNTTFTDIVPELMCARYLSDLKSGNTNRAPNFPFLHNIALIRGLYPKTLTKAWWKFTMEPNSEVQSPRPDLYDKDQFFLTIEAENCGMDIAAAEEVFANDAVVCVICICQVVAALAVAESAFHFEHRDLHFGNLLFKPTDVAELLYAIDGRPFHVHSYGYQFYIIDYTMSRIDVDGKIYFLPMGTDETERSALVRSDWTDMRYVYEVQARVHNDNWEEYHPYTNVLWIRYLIENFHDLLCQNAKTNGTMDEMHDQIDALLLLSRWKCTILQHYNSSADFFLSEVVDKVPYVKYSN